MNFIEITPEKTGVKMLMAVASIKAVKVEDKARARLITNVEGHAAFVVKESYEQVSLMLAVPIVARESWREHAGHIALATQPREPAPAPPPMGVMALQGPGIAEPKAFDPLSLDD
jgi:hypothetical protein